MPAQKEMHVLKELKDDRANNLTNFLNIDLING